MNIIKKFIGAFVLTIILSAGVSGTTGCDSATGNCCKVCTTGKACGDSCIAKNKTCNAGAGCACNG